MIPIETILIDAAKMLRDDEINHPYPQEKEIRSRAVIYMNHQGPPESYLVTFEFENGKWNAKDINGKQIKEKNP